MRLDLIEPALKKSGLTLIDLQNETSTGKLIFLEGPNSILVLQLVDDEEGRSVHAWLGGGSLDEIKQMLPGAEGLCRGLGCRFASFRGRKGWGRAFPEYRWNGSENRKML